MTAFLLSTLALAAVATAVSLIYFLREVARERNAKKQCIRIHEEIKHADAQRS